MSPKRKKTGVHRVSGKVVIISDPSLRSPARYGVSELSRTLKNAGFDIKEGVKKGTPVRQILPPI